MCESFACSFTLDMHMTQKDRTSDQGRTRAPERRAPPAGAARIPGRPRTVRIQYKSPVVSCRVANYYYGSCATL